MRLTHSLSIRRSATAAGVGFAAALLFLGFAAGTASARGPFLLPPDGVYTCAWIAENPTAAAAAQVTCDPAVFSARMASLSAPSGSEALMDSGSQYLPSASTRAGQGVFVWTSYKYVTSWSWYGIFGDPYYTWYIQKTGDQTYTYGPVIDTDVHQQGVPANIYRWGAQNHSSVPQRWFVVWGDS